MSTIELPSGFEVVRADSLPKITLDRQKRFYFGTNTRKQLGLEAYDKIVLAYNAVDKQLAVIQAHAFADGRNVYMIDKRGYVSARKFIEEYRYRSESAPFEFVIDRALSDEGSAFVFTLVDA